MPSMYMKARNSNRSRQRTGDSNTFVKQDIPPFTCSCITVLGDFFNLQFTVNEYFDVTQRQTVSVYPSGTWVGRPGAWRDPDKLDLTRFSGYKFEPPTPRDLVDLLHPESEMSLNRQC
ncbi:hypothetical protein TNCV_2574951 [Trichonephila clavipes]|nr:hypothetical protein TNCV_2574951 [Trichonephila clavipes]